MARSSEHNSEDVLVDLLQLLRLVLHCLELAQVFLRLPWLLPECHGLQILLSFCFLLRLHFGLHSRLCLRLQEQHPLLRSLPLLLFPLLLLLLAGFNLAAECLLEILLLANDCH